MPTNLPPEYFDAEERFRAAETSSERIACLEDLIATVPKHKGTDKLRADLRRKLSKLREAAETQKGGGKHESVYHVEKEGAGRIVVAGAPNTGKSALVAALTHAAPKVSEYPFTTWTPVPGMIPFRDIQIQLIDTPAVSSEHVEHELFDLIRSADLILLMLDLQGAPLQEFDDAVALLEHHRIRLDCGGEVSPSDRRATVIPGMILVNKVDDESWDEEFAVLRELLEGRGALWPISVQTGRNLEALKETLFDRLEIVRVYSKMPGKDADLGAPFALKRGNTIEEFAAKVHQDFVENLKTARIWGEGVHDGQMVGRDHVLHDGDIVELRM